MNRREMLATTGAATLGALVMPKVLKAEAPASQVAIVRCRDYFDRANMYEPLGLMHLMAS